MCVVASVCTESEFRKTMHVLITRSVWGLLLEEQMLWSDLKSPHHNLFKFKASR